MLSQKLGRTLFLIAPFLMVHLLIYTSWLDQPMPPAQSGQGEAQVTVDAPHPGDVLQGQVAIRGTTTLPGFRSVEVDFAYQSDPTHTWFLIQQGSAPVKEGALASWDTTTISDGEYQLRVRVFLQDGQVKESVISGLRVRNYTLIETSTPEIGSVRRTATPTSTPLPDFAPRAGSQGVQSIPTPLPTNPAQVTGQGLRTSVLQGAVAVLGIFLAAGVYLGLRLWTRR